MLPLEASLALAPLQGLPWSRWPAPSCLWGPGGAAVLIGQGFDSLAASVSHGRAIPWPCLECSSTGITMTESLTCFRLLLKITFPLKLHWPVYFKWHPTPSDIPTLTLIFPTAFISLKHTLVTYLFIISITRFLQSTGYMTFKGRQVNCSDSYKLNIWSLVISQLPPPSSSSCLCPFCSYLRNAA